MELTWAEDRAPVGTDLSADPGVVSEVRAVALLPPTLLAYNTGPVLQLACARHYAERGYNIRCNSVHPGAIHTPIIDKVLAQSDTPEALYASFVAVHPVGRLGRPEEIAAIAAYLASDESAFATGAEFRIDGGSTL